MKKIDVVLIAVSLVVSFLCYLTTYNIFYSLIIFVLYLLDYFILLRKKMVEYEDEIERVHICYHFVNSFIITLSVKDSLDDAYLNATRVKGKKFSEMVNGTQNIPVVDRLKYLSDYFDLAIYKMFLNVFDLYQDQGGNILIMSENLIRECTRTEKTLSETVAIGYKHLIEFIVLWGLSILILVFMRFSIADFYLKMLNNTVVGLMVMLFFVISIASIHLFVGTFTSLKIKRGEKQCKK